MTPSTAYPVASCHAPSTWTPAFTSSVRASDRRKFIASARGAESATRSTRAHGLVTSAAEKSSPANTHEIRLRTPLHASSIPTVPRASSMMLPSRWAAIPRIPSARITPPDTHSWSPSVRRV